jgi:chromosome segregation ATPase
MPDPSFNADQRNGMGDEAADPAVFQELAAVREQRQTPSPQTRIRQLERALDIAMESLAAWKSQGRDWQLLSDRLASAEETTNVQHLAILKLKQRLLDQRQATHEQRAQLEQRVSQTNALEAQLEHACQEFQQQHEDDRHRILSLEAQVASLQEQVLHQAQQMKEYEAAIQHWRDHCSALETALHNNEQQLQQLQPVDGLNSPPHQSSVPVPTHSFDHDAAPKSKIDLPDFI